VSVFSTAAAGRVEVGGVEDDPVVERPLDGRLELADAAVVQVQLVGHARGKPGGALSGWLRGAARPARLRIASRDLS